ncbi:uncharacterized protein LOC119582233 [Penaeus monodon]|uniref:uncharacterized protein LOC119582233 n=1 Tax=Penaeus monodon TaxID=6687 RepID=UPI0018A70DDB|nr:uncharacterized protein LOC119582233 [Penaeus monodon]
METPTPGLVPGQQGRSASLADPRSNSSCEPHDAAGHVTPPRSSLTSDLADNALQRSPGRGGEAGADDLAAKLDGLRIMQQRPWYVSQLETPPESGLRRRNDVTPPKSVCGAHEPDPWSRVYEGRRSSSRQRSPLREEELTPETERLKEVMGFTSFFSPKDQWLQKSCAYDEEEEGPADLFHL